MKRLLSIVLVLSMLITCEVNAKDLNTLEGTKQIKCTAYTGGTVTASGDTPRYGICAGADELFYDRDEDSNWVAMVWTLDGEFIGYFEILDRGGKPIQDGYVLDIWHENLDECKEFMKLTEGKCLVKYVKAFG